MGSEQAGQGKEVLLAATRGRPDAVQVVARFCILFTFSGPPTYFPLIWLPPSTC